ncbi:MAG: helix-turn-helix domain-containing protein [Prevotella sp.]|jgi:AraC-like DNA-binding protein
MKMIRVGNRQYNDSHTTCILQGGMWLLLFLLLLLIALPSSGARSDHSALLQRMSNKPLSEIVKTANAKASHGKEEEALALYIFVCNKYNDNPDMEDNKHACAIAYLQIGNIYYKHSNYTGTLNNYVKGLEVCETEKKPVEKARLYNNIGNIYSAFKDYEKALSYFQEGYQSAKEVGNCDRKDVYNLLTNITTMQILTGNVKEAERSYRLALDYSDHKIPDNVFADRYSLILINAGKDKYKDAIAQCHQLLRYIFTHHMQPVYEGYVYEQLFQSFDALHEDDSTMFYLKKCQKVAKDNHLQHLFIDAYKIASDVYERKGNTRLAEKYRADYFTLMDSVYNLREFDVVKNIQFQYETDKINKEVSAIQAKERSHRQTIHFMTIIVIISVVFLIIMTLMWVIVLRQKRHIKENYSSLFKIYKRLTENQENYKQQHLQDKQQLMEAEQKINELSNQNKDDKKANKDSKRDEEQKYTRSKLTPDLMQQLADAITNLMDHSTLYCSPDFSLDKLATALNSNTAYISQTINGTFHKNFATFVNEYRVQLACQRLADTEHFGNLTVKGIGAGVGFKSPSTFMTTFKRITGMTPYMYQQLALNDKGTSQDDMT